ncbi:MAG: hypothetical protein Q8Q09_19700 [Deltaproteobacteria bacterium]|nr:hypothetical protein [Deltaproteobacteria bacterium]
MTDLLRSACCLGLILLAACAAPPVVSEDSAPPGDVADSAITDDVSASEDVAIVDDVAEDAAMVLMDASEQDTSVTPPRDAMVAQDSAVSDGAIRCRSNLGRDCPVGQACSARGECTPSCSFDWRCNTGCCQGGRCAGGTELNACGTSSAQAWRCGDCAAGCTAGAACGAVTGGGACACTSCRPIGASCARSTDCCSRSCAGLNGNLRCQ